jgi:hypothetical protein
MVNTPNPNVEECTDVVITTSPMALLGLRTIEAEILGEPEEVVLDLMQSDKMEEPEMEVVTDDILTSD